MHWYKLLGGKIAYMNFHSSQDLTANTSYLGKIARSRRSIPPLTLNPLRRLGRYLSKDRVRRRDPMLTHLKQRSLLDYG